MSEASLGVRALRGASFGMGLALAACLGPIEAAYGVAETLCEDYSPVSLSVGDNAVSLNPDNPSPVPQSCGGGGAASLYTFTAPALASYEFAIEDGDFDPVLSLYGVSCNDLFDEHECVLPPSTITLSLSEGETVHLVVDSVDAVEVGAGTLSITQQ